MSHLLKLQIIQGDITAQADIDAAVNAANAGLKAGSGVCGAVLAAGGESIFEECEVIGHCPIGGAAVTGAGEMPNKIIVHAVGPIYHQYTPMGAQALLESAHIEAINAAAIAGCSSIAFPALSCGIYGYPIDEAAPVALESAAEAALNAGLSTVRFVLFSDADYATFKQAARQVGFDPEVSVSYAVSSQA